MSSAESVDFPYRALSKGAIASLVLAALALPGMVPAFAPLLALTLPGAVAAVIGLNGIRRFPEEFSGRGLATIGLVANLALLLGGISLHTYIYLTEVPEGYTRVQFYDLQVPDGQPQQPTQTALEINGQSVFLKGYIHPSSGGGMLRQFILVPDLGTCCFGGQPKTSDMIEVTLMDGQSTRAGFIKKKLAGRFLLNPAATKLTDFDNPVWYQMRVEVVR